MCIKLLWWLNTVPIMNTIHWFISDISQQTYINEIMDINATFWHRAKVYFACIKSLLWLLTVPNMNTINTFFLRYHKKHRICMKNIAIITQIWHRCKCYFTCFSNTWYLISVPNMNIINPFFNEISQQIQKMYEKMAIITQIWQKRQTLFYMHQWSMVLWSWYPIWRKSIQPSWRNARGWTDRWTDAWTDGLNPFPYSLIPLRE